MTKILYYPIYWLAYALSLLPFCVLYRISGIIRFFLFSVFAYRRNVINENLKNAFPEKSANEINDIHKSFCKHFCDFFIESLKLLSIKEKTIKKRFVFDDASASLIESYFEKGKKVLIVLGHYGNWEYIGPGFKFWRSKPLISAYRPLKSSISERIVRKSRERFDTDMIPMKTLTREMFRRKNEVCGVLLLADQSPPMDIQSYWISFFNQDTPVFQGTEKLAQKFDLPVVFASIRKQKRGYYKAFFKLVTDTPKEMEPGEITLKHTMMLEKDIKREPAHWLWTHRRWKHKNKRGDNILLTSKKD